MAASAKTVAQSQNWVLNISQEGDSTASLCNLLKSWTHLTETSPVFFLLSGIYPSQSSQPHVISCERGSNPLIIFMALFWFPCLFCTAEPRSGSRERPEQSRKEERLSSKAKGKTILLILDVTYKPLSQLTESSLPPSLTQSPSIFFFVAV